jgi:hypothetical protein
MKYLKLFENWLLEAEGEGSIQFNPDKPWETFVFDITNDDIYGDPVKLGGILRSVLAKSFDKKELADSKSVSVIPLYPYDFTADSKAIVLYSKPSGQGDKYSIPTETSKFAQKLKSLGVDFRDFTDNQTIYLVTLGNNQNWKDKDNNIQITPKNFFVFADSKPKDAKHSLNSEWITVTDIANPMKATLGQIAAFSSSKFENVALLKDKNVGTPNAIAGLFGYEIPEDYTPKAGGATKKGK